MEAIIVRMSRKRRPFLRFAAGSLSYATAGRERRTSLNVHRQSATILPGFMMLCGSMARFKARIRSSAARPCSISRYFIFFCPTPCSPVQVPSMASARFDQPVDESFAGLDLGRIVHVHERLNMEVAVADMADDGRDQATSPRCRAWFPRRIRQAARSARRHRSRPTRRPAAGPARPNRRRAAPARASVRSSGFGRPVEGSAGELRRYLAEALRLLLTPAARCRGIRAASSGLSGRVELGMEIDRPHLNLVEQFDPRDRNAGLDRHDDRVAGRLDARERANPCRDRLGNAVELEGDFGDDAERPLRSDEEAGEVIAGGALAAPGSRS